MQGAVSLLAIVGLPLLAGLMIACFAGAWRSWFGAERALALAGRVAIGGTVLAALLLATAVRSLARRTDVLPVQSVPWAGAGRTTTLDLDLELAGVALAVSGLALLVALAAQMAALGDPRDGLRSLARTSMLLGGTLLLGLSATVWGAAIGWQIVALVVGASGRAKVSPGTGGLEDMSQGAGPSGHVAKDRWARLGDAGVWLAVLAIAVGAGDLSIELLTRGVMMGEHSRLLVAGSFAAAPAYVASLGLLVAVAARLCGLPAALRGEGPASRAALLGLASGAGVLLLLRVHVLLVLAPTVMAGLTLAGAIAAVLAGVAGLRATSPALALARVSQATVALMLVAIGLGAWMPAFGLWISHALASGALALARGGQGRVGVAGRWLAGLALAGLIPTSVALWSGEVLGVAYMYMSAWSPGLNVAAAGLTALAVVTIAGAIAHVLRDRPVGGSTEASLAAGLLAAAAVGVAVIDLPGSLAALRVWLGPEFTASWLLRDDYALGPRPPFTVELARWGVAAVVVLAGLGLVAARRLRAWAGRVPVGRIELAGARRIGRGLVVALHELGERRVLGPLLLGPAGPEVARAPGPGNPQAGVVLGLFGALAVLGVVYCNPDVVTVGPTRVYPVDVGGLNPALLGARRGARASGETGAAGEPAPGTGAGEPAPGTGAGGAGELAPGTGAGELAPGTGAAGASGELAPGTGAGGAVELAPGTGAGELPPGTGAVELTPGTGAGELVPGTGAAGASGALAPGTGAGELAPGTGAAGVESELAPGTGASSLSRGTGEPAAMRPEGGP